jgi:hypothetical protein
MSPFLLKVGAVGVVAVTLFVTGCVEGRKQVRVLWDAERASYAVAAAQATARHKETERIWVEYTRGAEVAYGQNMLVTTTRANTERQRLRDAAATRERVVSATTVAPGGCSECPRCATKSELLGLGEGIVDLAQSADSERAGLIACAQAWPR